MQARGLLMMEHRLILLFIIQILEFSVLLAETIMVGITD